jgi:hypothetical protein
MHKKFYSKETGLSKKISEGRRQFAIPENIKHYSPSNYKAAERKFIKWCILEERC